MSASDPKRTSAALQKSAPDRAMAVIDQHGEMAREQQDAQSPRLGSATRRTTPKCSTIPMSRREETRDHKLCAQRVLRMACASFLFFYVCASAETPPRATSDYVDSKVIEGQTAPGGRSAKSMSVATDAGQSVLVR